MYYGFKEVFFKNVLIAPAPHGNVYYIKLLIVANNDGLMPNSLLIRVGKSLS